MNDFFKRNLVWIAILLCIAGVVLSIIGIPVGNPIFFFIGVVLSIPTIGYLIYQIFFYNDNVELNLAPVSNKFSSSNITSIITNKNDILFKDEITNDDDLDSLYNGYADEAEIEKQLHELTNQERERVIIDLPKIVLPEAQPYQKVENDIAIQNTTNIELNRQRELNLNNIDTFSTEIPTELIQENSALQDTDNNNFENIDTIDTTEPVSIEDESISHVLEETKQENNNPTNTSPATKVIQVNTQSIALRQQRTQEKKTLLAQANLERYLRRYFIETAACFLMDRTIYKDKTGIAPYNKFAVNKDTNLPEYSMSSTKGRLYKFCTFLVDAERFITHPNLYNDFVTAIERGVSLSRISETLHPLYRKKYKKDFILNLSNREDWDNVMILVYNNYILNNDNFKDVFTHIPFEIPYAYKDENIIDYLKDCDLQERFSEKFSALEEMGVPTFWDALYICFINSIKQKLSTEQLETAILKEYKKIARSLKRADVSRRKLKKVS